MSREIFTPKKNNIKRTKKVLKIPKIESKFIKLFLSQKAII